MAGNPPYTLVCPNCQYENDSQAEFCVRCGTQLVRTIPVRTQFSETKAITAEQAQKIYGEPALPGAVTFLVAGYPDPLVITKRGDIVLGRRLPNESAPTIDMTKYNGHLLGVSRRHAIINYANETYTLEDLNSTNGTWLNENKLPPNKPYPLRGGDQIRLGNLILFIYFSVITSINLVDDQEPLAASHVLTPQYIEHRLGPYLSALAELQHITDALLEHKPSSVVIRSITASSRNIIQVKMDGMVEAVKLTKEYIDPWKKGRTSTLAQLQERSEEMLAKVHNGGADLPPREDQTALARELITRIKPLLSDEAVLERVQALSDPLRILTASPLEIMDTPQA